MKQPFKPHNLQGFSKQGQQGFTVMEILVALSLLLVLVMSTSNLAASSYHSDRRVEERNQLTQVMMGMGRRLAAGDPLVLPAAGQATRTFNAAALQGMGFQDTNDMTSTITAQGNLTHSGNTFLQYQLKVCWRVKTCVSTTVAAPEGR